MIVMQAIAIGVLAAILVFVWDELFAILGTATSKGGEPQAARSSTPARGLGTLRRVDVPSPPLDAVSPGTDAHGSRRHPL